MPLSEIPGPLVDASGDEPPLVRVAPPGPQSRAVAARLAKVECPAFGARRDARSDASGADMSPIVLASGKGANLFDVDGNRYVDLAAGFGSLLLGHRAPSVLSAIEGQANRLVQGLGDVYGSDAKVALLERLAALAPFSDARVLLAQSGSDAVTGAMKTAVLATGKPGVIAFEGAYHGLGYAPLAACGLRESYRAPFRGQLGKHVAFAPYPRTHEDVERSLAAVDQVLGQGYFGAVIVEPILGRGGCVVPPEEFLAGLSTLAHDRGALVIADEIWTGLGRTGAMMRTTAPVDIVCFGKGLGGGLPISAAIAPDSIMRSWAKSADEEVVHTSTHAGQPLACAAAVATLDALRFRHLPARAKTLGDTFRDALTKELTGKPGFVAVRGAGLLVGIELASGNLALRTARKLLGRGYIVLTGGTANAVLTVTPALSIGEERLVGFTEALADALG